jgi:hypothetical protein
LEAGRSRASTPLPITDAFAEARAFLFMTCRPGYDPRALLKV